MKIIQQFKAVVSKQESSLFGELKSESESENLYMLESAYFLPLELLFES